MSTPPDGSRFLLALPDDVLALISSSLLPSDLCNLSLTSRALRSLASSDKLWLPQCERLLAPTDRLLAWRAAVRSFKSLCRFLVASQAFLGLWVHQNPELGNVVFAFLGFASVVACRVVPQEVGPAGIDGTPILWSPVFEIVADGDGKPLLFLHGREKEVDFIYPGSIRSLDPDSNILLLEVEPAAAGNGGGRNGGLQPPLPRLLNSKSFIRLKSDSEGTARRIRRSDTIICRLSGHRGARSDASFGKLAFRDRRKLLDLVAGQVRIIVPSGGRGQIFPHERFTEDVIRLTARRSALILLYNKRRHARADYLLGSDVAAKKVLELTDSSQGEESGNLQIAKRQSIGRYFRNGLKQILGRSNSSSYGGCSSSSSSDCLFMENGSSSSENKHAHLNDFLKLGDTMGLCLQASKVKLSTYRAWPNMHDNKFALYKLPLRSPSPGREYAGLWGGTFGWPPGRATEEKPGKALFFLLLSYEECEGQRNLIATKILEGTHYVLHPNGSAMFVVKIDEPSWDTFPFGNGEDSAPVEIKCAYNGEGIANGYGFRYPGSKPGSLFVTQSGLLVFVWKESRTVLTMQRLDLAELLKQGERVPALPPIANFVYLTKSYSNVFAGFSSATSYLSSSRDFEARNRVADSVSSELLIR